jgi:hypothetical protein
MTMPEMRMKPSAADVKNRFPPVSTVNPGALAADVVGDHHDDAEPAQEIEAQVTTRRTRQSSTKDAALRHCTHRREDHDEKRLGGERP